MSISVRKVKKLNLVMLLDAQIFDYDQDSPVTLEGAHWWVAFDDGKPVAFAGVKITIRDRFAYFCRAGVLPSHRGRGLQARLIRARVAWAKKQGIKQAITDTVIDNAPSSNNLIKCGFKLYTPESKWCGSQALYWSRKL